MIPLSYNVRSLMVRKTTTIATAGGIALVVFVLAAALMLSAGVSKTLVAGGRTDNAIVTRKGSDTEMASSIEQKSVSLILATPGVKKDESGPLGGGEVVVVIAQDRLGGEAGQVTNILVRGVSENVLKVRPDVHIIDGRPAKPGTDECIIGKGLVGKYKGMTIGDKFDLKKNRPVTVVGVFEAGGSSFESEVWASLDTARSSFGREGLVSSVTVRLESPAKFDAFKAMIETDKQLLLEARRETKYYQDQSQGTSIFISIMGAVIAVFCAAGATIGAMNTMFAAVAQRKREVGTLRALGFSRFQIMFSFVVESSVLALAGGVVGLVMALLLSAQRVSMMNFQTWQEISFGFAATPGILLGSILAGAGMGIVGGLLPAFKAAGTSPIEAMRG
jgi:putative ABC transport system permease protein